MSAAQNRFQQARSPMRGSAHTTVPNKGPQ